MATLILCSPNSTRAVCSRVLPLATVRRTPDAEDFVVGKERFRNPEFYIPSLPNQCWVLAGKELFPLRETSSSLVWDCGVGVRKRMVMNGYWKMNEQVANKQVL